MFISSINGIPPKPIEFFTQTPSDQIFVLARTRGNGTPEQSMNIATLLENRISEIEGVESVYTVVGPGAAGQGGEASLNSPDNVPIDATVRIYTELIPFSDRSRSVSDIIEDLETASSNIPGVLTEITAISQGPPMDKDIGIQISSDNREMLKEITLLIHNKLASIEGVYDTEDTLPLPGVDWSMEVDRAEAGRLGLDISKIGEFSSVYYRRSSYWTLPTTQCGRRSRHSLALPELISRSFTTRHSKNTNTSRGYTHF